MTSTEPDAFVGQAPGAGSAFAGHVTSKRVRVGVAKVAEGFWTPTVRQ